MKQIKSTGMEINPERLREARIAAGLSMKEVASRLSISPQALSLFELNRCRPMVEVFMQLVKMYGMPLRFYLNTSQASVDGPVYFRKLSSATKGKRMSAKTKAQWFCRNIFKNISPVIQFPAVSPLFHTMDESLFSASPEEKAEYVRRQWMLSDTPIKNMIRLLERHGIIVVVMPLDAEIDGFSFWFDGRPFIFINRENTAVRLRMSAAHELCHLLFHMARDVESEHKALEEEAASFAGAFLLPPSFLSDVSSFSLNSLLRLKPMWKSSLSSMVIRCHELEIIDDNRYSYLQTQISRKHWRKKEPDDDEYPQEYPVLMQQAISMMVDHDYCTKQELLENLALPAGFVEETCHLPKGYFSTDDQTIISFKNYR